MGALDSRVAIVTGSSRGIGLEVARALSAEGAAVVINGRDGDVLDAAVAELRDSGVQAAGVPGEAWRSETVTDLIEAAQEFGPIGILINCAGTAEPVGSSILNISDDDWHGLIDAHLNTVFATCRAVAPLMVEQGKGAIVNTSSHAFTGAFGGTGYAAGKGAVNSLTYAIAGELKEHGIRVNAVCPGAKTRLSTGGDYEQTIEQLHERGILNELMYAGALDPAPADYVARLYAFLVSDYAESITGQVFSGSGLYVGHFPNPVEDLVAFDDHSKRSPYTLQELRDLIVKTDQG